MRWFLWLLAGLAALAGVLFLVGQFFLSNSLSVTRSAAIDRPRAIIFALANDLRVAKEWSPFYAMDPDADYSFTGDGPGRGQEMRWASKSRRVGSGRMTIQESTENEAIESDIVLRDRASLHSNMKLERAEGNSTAVAWSVTAECPSGVTNVLCRYFVNVVLRGAVERELDNGLARLQTLAEQLPDVDFEGMELSREQIAAQPILFVDVTAEQTVAERDAAESDGLSRLNAYFAESNLSPDGAVVRIFPPAQVASRHRSWIVGYPYSGPEPSRFSGGVRPGETPGGSVIRFVHVGPRSQLGQTYLRACAYLLAHRELPYARPGHAPSCDEQPEGVIPWEVVRSRTASPTGGETVERTEVYYPVEERR
jgi:hypothetical protein